jgi:hypothetical protein
MNPNHPTDLLPGFAMGSLEKPEVEKVRRHLHNCPICQAEVAGYRNVIDQLAFETPLRHPNKRKVRHTPLHGPHATSGYWLAELALTWPRLFPALLLMCLVTIAALVVTSMIIWQRAQIITAADLDRTRVVEFRPMAPASGASGAMLIEAGAQRGLLIVRDLPPLGENMQYQLWLIQKNQSTSGGVLTVSSQGDGRLEITPPKPFAEFDSFSISIEPFGGSPWPTGSTVLRGRLQN